MKTGKFMRSVCTGMLAGGLMLPLSVGAKNESINIQVTINNPLPTCNITIPNGNTRKLGTLDRSGKEQAHSSFTIQANCTGNVRVKLQANATSGVVQGDGTRLAVNTGGVASSAGPFLKLKSVQDNNRFIKLRISDNDWFCIAAGNSQTCTLTPVTISDAQTPAVEGSATVNFTVGYIL